MVAIFEKLSTTNLKFLCAGTIISSEFVLTSADCIYYYQANQLKLRAGRNSVHSTLFEIQETDATHIIMQNNYNNMFNHNIALIRLFAPYDFKRTANINSIRIYQQDNKVNQYQNCFVSSWPTYIENNIIYYSVTGDLVKHQLTIVNIQDCVTKIRNWRPEFPFDESIFCAGNPNSDVNFNDIQGGSPLLCQLNDEPYNGYLVVGILAQNNATFPYIFTNVVKELTWISNALQKIK